MFSHAYVGDEEALLFDLKKVRKLLHGDQKCHSQKLSSSLSRKEANNGMGRVVGHAKWPDDKPMDVWNCEQTMKNTAFAMMALADRIPRTSIKILVVKLIDDLKESAISCCYRGGLWSACVRPMVKKLELWNEKWKMFGIPPDPAWD